jgi:hypothetical protein
MKFYLHKSAPAIKGYRKYRQLLATKHVQQSQHCTDLFYLGISTAIASAAQRFARWA